MAAEKSMLSTLEAAGLRSVVTIEATDGNTKESYNKFLVATTQETVRLLRGHIPGKIVSLTEKCGLSYSTGKYLLTDDLHKQIFDCDKHYCTLAQPASEGTKKIKTSHDSSAVVTASHDMCSCRFFQTCKASKQISDAIKKIKLETADLIETVSTIKLWVQLNIPRIEDGDNFGVGIQEEAVQELARVEEATLNIFDAVHKYYATRGKLISKVFKYPKLKDYQESIHQLDEKQWLNIKITYMDIRNNYTVLYDLLSKNWEKVIKPKNTDASKSMTF